MRTHDSLVYYQFIMTMITALRNFVVVTCFLDITSNAFLSTGPRSAALNTAVFMSGDEPIADTLDPSQTAFVFIEYQNEFCSPGGKFHEAVKDCMESTNMLENSVQAVDAARRAGCQIIHCPIDFEPGHFEIASSPYGILAGVKAEGAFVSKEWGSDFISEMKPKPGDMVVKGKSGLCGFASTNLEFLLGQSGAKNVVLGGFLTNCCVESTMR